MKLPTYKLLLKIAIANVMADVGKATKDRFDRAADRLTTILSKNWDSQQTTALSNALRVFLRSPADLATRENMDALQRSLSADLSVPVGAAVKGDLDRATDLIYAAGAKEIVPTGFSYNLIDQKAVNALGALSVSGVGGFYDAVLAEPIAALAAQAIQDGLTKNQAAALFRDTFKEVFPKRTLSYWKMTGNNVVTLSRSLGQVSGYVDAGITVYEIIAIKDLKTSEVCLFMNGKRFAVRDGVQLRDAIIDSPTPEAARAVNAWQKFEDIEGLSTAQLPQGMRLPPYHGNCRTTTAAVG